MILTWYMLVSGMDGLFLLVLLSHLRSSLASSWSADSDGEHSRLLHESSSVLKPGGVMVRSRGGHVTRLAVSPPPKRHSDISQRSCSSERSRGEHVTITSEARSLESECQPRVSFMVMIMPVAQDLVSICPKNEALIFRKKLCHHKRTFLPSAFHCWHEV
jgi:hypothetical protein